MQPVVAALLHRHVVAGAADDERLPDPWRVGHRRVRRLLQRDGRAAPPRLVLRDQDLAAHVVRAVGERVGREAAEDDGVRRAEPRAREHRDRKLGDHAHVDRDLRPLADAELLERVREADDLGLELGVRELPPVALRLALPEVGDAIAEAGVDVPVDAVVRDVELAAEVPLRVGKLPLVELREGLEPRHALAALALPELVEVALVDVGLRHRERGEVGRRRVAPVLREDRLDRLVAHARFLTTPGAARSGRPPARAPRMRFSARVPVGLRAARVRCRRGGSAVPPPRSGRPPRAPAGAARRGSRTRTRAASRSAPGSSAR